MNKFQILLVLGCCFLALALAKPAFDEEEEFLGDHHFHGCGKGHHKGHHRGHHKFNITCLPPTSVQDLEKSCLTADMKTFFEQYRSVYCNKSTTPDQKKQLRVQLKAYVLQYTECVLSGTGIPQNNYTQINTDALNKYISDYQAPQQIKTDMTNAIPNCTERFQTEVKSPRNNRFPPRAMLKFLGCLLLSNREDFKKLCIVKNNKNKEADIMPNIHQSVFYTNNVEEESFESFESIEMTR